MASASDGAAADRVVAKDPRPLTNTLVMSVGFFFVKGGYIPVQSFASSLLDLSCIPLGNISIGIVGCCVRIASSVACCCVQCACACVRVCVCVCVCLAIVYHVHPPTPLSMSLCLNYNLCLPHCGQYETSL